MNTFKWSKKHKYKLNVSIKDSIINMNWNYILQATTESVNILIKIFQTLWSLVSKPWLVYKLVYFPQNGEHITTYLLGNRFVSEGFSSDIEIVFRANRSRVIRELDIFIEGSHGVWVD